MNISIQVDRNVYDALQKGKKVKGSLALTDDGVGNFRRYECQAGTPKEKPQIRLLKCGRAVVTEKEYRVWLRVERAKGVKSPVATILDDFKDAEDFLNGFKYEDF